VPVSDAVYAAKNVRRGISEWIIGGQFPEIYVLCVTAVSVYALKKPLHCSETGWWNNADMKSIAGIREIRLFDYLSKNYD